MKLIEITMGDSRIHIYENNSKEQIDRMVYVLDACPDWSSRNVGRLMEDEIGIVEGV